MWRAKRSRYAYLYILPFFIVFLIFKLYPIIYTFVLSLCDMDLLSGDLTYVACTTTAVCSIRNSSTAPSETPS